MSDDRRTLVFVLCPGHSGSTLLGHFLGAHSQVLHLGEVLAPVRRRRPFVCRVCESGACPVWGSLLSEPLVRDAVAQFQRDRLAPLAWRSLLSRLGARDLRGAVHRPLFEGLPGTRVVVDSSKTLRWMQWNRGGAGELRVVLLHLRRDLRGVVASHLRAGLGDTVEDVARPLVAQQRRIAAAMASVPAEDSLCVHYEDLVTRPQETGVGLCADLGLDYEPEMQGYYRFPQHVIGGNPAPTHQVREHHGASDPSLEFLSGTSQDNQRYYRQVEPGFRLDLRWQTQLTPDMLEEFDEIAGDTNRRLGYPHPAVEEPTR